MPAPGYTLAALSIGGRVHRHLSRPRQGRVVATFTRSGYLELDGQIVALVTPELLNGPLNVVIDPPAGFAFAALADLPVRTTPAEITIGPASAPGIAPAGPEAATEAVRIALGAAQLWDAAIPPLSADPDLVRRNLALLRTLLQAHAPAGSLAPVAVGAQDPGQASALAARAGEAIEALRAAMAIRSPGAIAAAAGRLAGLGSGLTPSGDDLLVGVLVAVAAAAPPEGKAVRAAIRTAAGRTTAISRAYLEAAASGEAGEAWHWLLAALAADDPAQLTRAALRLLAFGETSGADLLAGFALAIEYLHA